jgi:alpha-L-arabinofuranosidase
MKKNAITILLICFSFQLFFSQSSLSLSVKKKSDKTLTETEHYYLMEVTNTTSDAIKFNVAFKNTACQNVNASKQAPLNQSVLNKDKSKALKQLNVKPNESLEFYVKISRLKNTKLDTWNCSEVKAISNTGELLSNSVTIKSLIPDPKKFN